LGYPCSPSQNFLLLQDKLTVLVDINALASCEPGAIANPAHADLFADTLIQLLGDFSPPLGAQALICIPLPSDLPSAASSGHLSCVPMIAYTLS